MAGIGDELLLCLHIFEIGDDGSPGEDHHKAKDHPQADGRDDQGDEQQGLHGLQLPLGIEEQHHGFSAFAADEVPVAAFVAAGSPLGEDGLGVVLRLRLGNGSDVVLVDPLHRAAFVQVYREEPDHIGNLRGKPPHVLKGRRDLSGGSVVIGSVHLQKPVKGRILLPGHAGVVPEIYKAQKRHHHRGEGRHGRTDEPPAQFLQHDISSRA